MRNIIITSLRNDEGLTMAKRAVKKQEAEVVALYDAMVAGAEGVERKGATMPYTALNGNMFSFVTKEGAVALRLGEDDRAAFLNNHGGKPVVQHGAVMKEYVAIPMSVLKDVAEAQKWFSKSLGYARGLKAKKK